MCKKVRGGDLTVMGGATEAEEKTVSEDCQRRKRKHRKKDREGRESTEKRCG